jgi:hypothetical protein
MSVMTLEREVCKVTFYGPDPSFTSFVAKLQKAKTRKDKDYFVLRATIPKEVAEEVDAEPGDYLLFRAKKAQWYHLLDWKAMDDSWKMLPDDIKNRVFMDGLYSKEITNQSVLGATNMRGITQQALMETKPVGGIQWK